MTTRAAPIFLTILSLLIRRSRHQSSRDRHTLQDAERWDQPRDPDRFSRAFGAGRYWTRGPRPWTLVPCSGAKTHMGRSLLFRQPVHQIHRPNERARRGHRAEPFLEDRDHVARAIQGGERAVDGEPEPGVASTEHQ